MNLIQSKLPLPTFRSRSSQKREDLISSSLTSSRALSERLASWSSNRDRAQPCSMKFHKEWQHPDCKVMKWYKMQTESSTQFTSIEHWSSSEAPFFHEYLLIKLTDGSICRVERMGEGSRTNAIRWVGCNAHDLIQWYSEEDYDNNSFYQKPPRLIVEVSFPQPFDLLDVLAICYSVQRHQRSRSYTLQRYNCYFLCSTILAILTRRIGQQEYSIAEPLWKDTVESILDDLSHVNRKDPVHFVAFGIFSLLYPNSRNPAGFVLEYLRSSLCDTALSNLNNELSRTLWQMDLLSAIQNGLLPSVSNAICAVLEGSDPNSLELRSLLPRFDKQPNGETDRDISYIRPAISKLCIHAFSKTLKHTISRAQQRFDMRQLEAKHPLHKRLVSSISRLILVYPPIAYKILAHFRRDIGFHNFLREVQRRYGVNVFWTILTLPPPILVAGGVFFLSGVDHELDNDEALSNALVFMTEFLIGHLPPVVQELLDAEPLDAQMILALFRFYILEDAWKLSVWRCVLGKIGERIQAIPAANTIIVYQGNAQTRWTISKFQDHLWRRIQDHSKRVELCKLAAAQLVEEDIKNTMTEIWRSLPARFGGDAATHSSTSAIRRVIPQLPTAQLVLELIKKYQSLTCNGRGNDKAG